MYEPARFCLHAAPPTKNDDRRGAFTNAQKTIGRIIFEKKKKETTSDGRTFQISHQAIS